jgi:micrococcal nuclease
MIDTGGAAGGETGRVTDVIDGDTIDVMLDGEVLRVRYVGVNTPERDETCYSEAVEANRALVENQTVRLVKDVSETDRYGRLLRYVYVGDTFVNQQLVAEGFAEVVLYEPDERYYEDFLRFESNAARNDLGCHPTGIFNDNNNTR